MIYIYRIICMLLLVLCFAIIGCGNSENETVTNIYTVTYNANGADWGSVPVDNNTYEIEQTVTVLGNSGNIIKSGYIWASWNSSPDGTGDNYLPGQTFSIGNSNIILFAKWVNTSYNETYNIDNVCFRMVQVPAMTFPTGISDNGSADVSSNYWIGETEVSYELWSTVYIWAIDNDYTFANAGGMGGYYDGSVNTYSSGRETDPVTSINWRDAMIWCNALTEYFNAHNAASLECVYYTDSEYTMPIRTADDSTTIIYPDPGGQDDPYVDPDAKGFRLPVSNEWQLAARYINDANSDGDILDSGEYYPGNHVSGDTVGYCYPPDGISLVFGNFCWHNVNSGYSTHAVGTKIGNSLGLFDMGGNVCEWCFDWMGEGSNRIQHGGSFVDEAMLMQIGFYQGVDPYYEGYSMGFRLARTQ